MGQETHDLGMAELRDYVANQVMDLDFVEGHGGEVGAARHQIQALMKSYGLSFEDVETAIGEAYFVAEEGEPVYEDEFRKALEDLRAEATKISAA
ncbi:MAG: hypothetical protein HYS86_01715 [Candidatus Chisholmbacteria bacterium]|nr:hypothetical protein [Candidatus Chisholmbacteria bacterium]